MTFRIYVDREACIGCGACVGICDNFEMVDGKSSVIVEEVEKIGCNGDAESVCPVDAIEVDEVED